MSSLKKPCADQNTPLNPLEIPLGLSVVSNATTETVILWVLYVLEWLSGWFSYRFLWPWFASLCIHTMDTQLSSKPLHASTSSHMVHPTPNFMCWITPVLLSRIHLPEKIKQLGAEWHHKIISIAHFQAFLIIWDNLSIAFWVGEQHKTSKDHFDNGTMATLIPRYGIEYSEFNWNWTWRRSVTHISVLEFGPEDFLPSPEQVLQVESAKLWHIKDILYDSSLNLWFRCKTWWIVHRTRARRSFECLKLLRLEMFRLWKPRVLHHRYFLSEIIVSNILMQVMYFHCNSWLQDYKYIVWTHVTRKFYSVVQHWQIADLILRSFNQSVMHTLLLTMLKCADHHCFTLWWHSSDVRNLEITKCRSPTSPPVDSAS
jgi:hypothetical protein